MENYFTVEEVAEKFKVPESTIRKWLRTGLLKGVKLGGLWRISEKNLQDFISQSENK